MTSWLLGRAFGLVLVSGLSMGQVTSAPNRGFQVPELKPVLNKVEQTVPAQGATGVGLDRSTSIFFTRPLDPTTVGMQSVPITAGGVTVSADYALSFDKRVITITYPFFLPGDAMVQVDVDGDQLKGKNGKKTDPDGNGVPGGIFTLQFDTATAAPPPVVTDSALVMGQVFDAAGQPLAGATIDHVYCPATEGDPPLGSPVQSDANGEFALTTIPFTAEESFLVRIRLADHSEALRCVDVLAGGCIRVEDAALVPLSPPVFIPAATGGVIQDGSICLTIPPGALPDDMNLRMTELPSSAFLRDELPPLVSEAGTFIDVTGVEGEVSLIPVTLEVPNTYDLPAGTLVPFGKVDHNTLIWSDLNDLAQGSVQPGAFTGVVSQDEETIVVQFDHFCTICTGYCLPFPCPDPDPDPPPPCPPPPRPCPPGTCCPEVGGGGSGWGAGSSAVAFREGHLVEILGLPSVLEFGQEWTLQLGYHSEAASPSVTFQKSVAYDSTRPIEHTIFDFEVAGQAVQGIYGFTSNDEEPIGTWFWDGRDGLGQLLPTGAYPFSFVVTSLNADAPVAVPLEFGDVADQVFAGTYPGLTPLRSPEITGRTVLVNHVDSPYGAGWSVLQEDRIHFDPDGCLVLVHGNADWERYEPDPNVANLWASAASDFSTVVRNPVTGGYERRHPDGRMDLFGSDGRLQSRQDRYGFTTTYSYAGGLLSRITTPTGHTFDFGYDGTSKLQSIVDSAGRTTLFVVDAAGDLVAMTDANGSTRTFGYDANHLLVQQTGSRGEVTEYDFVAARVVETRSFDTDGTTLLRRRTYAPSVLNGEITSAASLGLGTSLGMPIPPVLSFVDAWVDGRGGAWIHETDERGLTILEEDPLGRRTEYVNEDDRLVASRTRPDGSVTEFDYDANGNTTEIRELSDATTLYSTTTAEYDGPFEQVSRIVDAESHETTFEYDALGNLTAIVDDLAQRTEMLYDDLSFPQLVTLRLHPTGDEVAFAYDVHGNLQAMTDFPDPQGQPQGRTTTFVRDAAGNVTDVLDPRSNTRSFTYDGLNRVTSATDERSFTTSYDYGDAGCSCSSGEVTKVTFHDGSTIRFEYDGLYRTTKRIDQLSNETLYAYDAEDNLLTLQNRVGEVLAHTYDAAGQLVEVDLDGQQTFRFERDLLGSVTLADDGDCTVERTNDFFGRLVDESVFIDLDVGRGAPFPLEVSLHYAYDRVGNRISLADDAGVIDLTYGYDELDRLTSLAQNGAVSGTWSFGYDEVGRPTSIGRGSGVSTAMTYDAAGQPTGIQHATTPALDLAYTAYDGNGNLEAAALQLASGRLDQAFTYDPANQLDTATYSVVYGDGRFDSSLSFGPGNRIQSDGEFDYTFDAEGRLTRRERPGSGVHEDFEYNALGWLERITQVFDGPMGPEIQLEVLYAYDPLGRRIEKVVNGVCSRFVYDDSDLLQERDGADQVVRAYVHGLRLDEPMAVIDVLAEELSDFYVDRLGSVVVIADATGAVVQEYVYDEYGRVVDELAPGFWQPLQYTAREREQETDLWFYRARYYDPRLGRFLVEDPLGLEGGINLYVYVDNNPMNFVDPTGLTVELSSHDFKELHSHDYISRPKCKELASHD